MVVFLYATLGPAFRKSIWKIQVNLLFCLVPKKRKKEKKEIVQVKNMSKQINKHWTGFL